jgi:multidrug efflux pump subunit AcrB
MVKARSIDDVPIVAITLWGERYDDHTLRLFAGELAGRVKEVPDVSEVTLIGGRPREVRVELDPQRLSTYGLDPLLVQQAVRTANVRATAGGEVEAGATTALRAGLRLETADDVRRVVVAAHRQRAILLSDVASVVDGDARPTSYVAFHERGRSYPAVTLAIAKRAGTNAIDVARNIEHKLDLMKGTVVPRDLSISMTRNYGETAAEKSNELLWHMLLAVLSVSLLIWLALGRREAAVVLLAVPVTLALTLFTFYLYGYTLNRITLFALIFSIGILVDDAIVVVENIVRHARLSTDAEGGLIATAIRAVDEVGNPTILATLTVIAAILPMAFVGGLMGPYMRPIPVGASAAMVFSLLVAFIVTPWAGARLLKPAGAYGDGQESRLTSLYRRAMRPLLTEPRLRWAFLLSVVALLLVSIALVPLQLVHVKMLPFDNKSEFQVMIDMPDGTALEETARVASALADETMKDPAVRDIQSYAGTSAPYNFNGLVRHYFLRRGSHTADLQVNLLGKDERSEQSHTIAKRVRERLLPITRRFGATIQVAEVPPGPPVLQTLVAEVYGPDAQRRLTLAGQVRSIMERTPGVVDVDWYVEEPQRQIDLVVDAEKAAMAGIPASAVATVVRMATRGEAAGLLHDPRAAEDVPITLQLPRGAASDLTSITSIRLAGATPVAVGEVTRPSSSMVDSSLYRKNLQPVTYVTADVAGEAESPVYAILAMNRELATLTLPEAYGLEVFNARQPVDTTRFAMKWDGEWHVTIEVFRDLGLAFAAVLVLIYILVVGWFRSFVTPLTIMAAIPFSLVGILPAHAAMGAFFTATSMIGFIAGAGIVVRNSIILVDFVELRLAEGMSLEDAVVDAGAVRFRPMALTAVAVVAGSAVILFDPIFQGLAISLMAGEVASLLLSRVTVPVLYYLSRRRSGGHPAAVASARERFPTGGLS